MIGKIVRIARREYIEHVRTRSFVLGIVLTPALIFAWVQISDLMERMNRGGKPFVIVDASVAPAPEGRTFPGGRTPGADLGNRVRERWKESAWVLESVVRVDTPGALEATVEGLSQRTRAGELEGFAVLEGNLIRGSGTMRWYTRNLANDRLKRRLARVVTDVVRADRYVWYDVPEEKLAAIRASVISDEDVDVSGRSVRGDESAREAKLFIPMIFVYAIMIGVSMQAQTLLSSTIEEKSSRLVEVLLSSVSPLELMTGKILGLVGVTFTLMGVWTAAGAWLVMHNGWQSFVPWDVFPWFLVYLVLAILFYSALFVAIGAAVTELKEAQNLMTPVWILIMVPLMLMFFASRHPDALWAKVLSQVPFFAPFLMINRIASAVPPGWIERLASIVLTGVATLMAFYLAARIFRVAILLYGKPATPREMLRWMRTG